jgi:hypothetical protein
MSIKYAGLTAARARLQRLADGLREAAGGEVLARATAKMGEQIAAVAEQKTAAHMDTGAARGSVELAVSSGRVQLTTVGYLRYHSWWPFRRGMPGFVVKRAALVLARELVEAIGGDGSALAAEAQAVADDGDAAATKAASKSANKRPRKRAKP